MAPGATDAAATAGSSAEDDWGVLTVLAYVEYDSKATTADPVQVDVSYQNKVFLPLTVRE